MDACATLVTTGREELLRAVADIESSSMGLDVLYPVLARMGRRADASSAATSDPWRSALKVAAVYVAIFMGIPYLVHVAAPGSIPDLEHGIHGLYLLQLYGALWAGWATASTTIVIHSLCRTIRTEIAPRLQEDTCRAIADWMRANFRRGAVLRLSWLMGVLFSIAAGALIYADLDGRASLREVIFWSLGWCLLFATSTGVVIVGRFYSVFAAHLDREVASLYVVDPARSSLLRSVDSLGENMLFFWSLIAISIASIYGVRAWPTSGLSDSRFIIVEVALAGFFSIGVGSWVFLGSQAAIQRALLSATDPVLRAIEARAAEKLVGQAVLPDEEGWKALALLDEWHARIASTLSIRGRILSVVSLILPFIPLVSAVLAHIFGWKLGL